LRLRSGRAVAARPDEQGDLDKAIELATRPPHRSASARLTDRDGGRHLFRLSPVVGAARDVFDATSAIGVLISRPQPRAGALDLSIAIELFALAPRETRVAELLCEGLGIAEIARCLQIAPDTVRYHLKSIFEKTGARRQAEAVAILLGLQ
jgi:DNA-binding CsgD family transcriptional regulator